MKRTAALAPLSRDHQHALDAALRLRRADGDSAAAALDHFARFFASEGRRHFEIEEQLVLPALPRKDADWGAAVERVLADHDWIRGRADALGAGAPARDANELGARLNDHVRFEERVMFPMLESRLSAPELEELGAAIARAEAA